jgi:hypothetical protein
VGGDRAHALRTDFPISWGELREGATATDLVLTVTQMLRERGVVGKFVEFFGPGLPNLPLADRATIGNMSPEYGATCGIFPVGRETLRYLRFSGRSSGHVELVEAYCRRQGLFHDEGAPDPTFPTCSSSSCPASSRVWPGPGVRRTESRSGARRMISAPSLRVSWALSSTRAGTSPPP